MPIQGFIRFRKHQVGVNQSSITSNVAATRILPYRGPIDYEPTRTQPDVDTGSLDPILPSFFGAVEVTSTWKLPSVPVPDVAPRTDVESSFRTGNMLGRWTHRGDNGSSLQVQSSAELKILLLLK